MKNLRKLRAWFDRSQEFIAILSLTAMLGVVVIQVFSRFLLPKTPQWTEEMTRFLFAGLVALGAGIAVRDDAYVNVETLLDLFPARVSRVIRLVLKLITVGLMAVVARYSIPFMMLGTRQVSSSMEIPMIFPFSMTFISSFLIALYTVIGIVKDGRAPVRGPDIRDEDGA